MKLAGCYCTSWTETAGTRDPAITVDFTRHYEFSDGERLTSESSLRFSTESTLRKSLQRICFEIECVSELWPGHSSVHPSGPVGGERHCQILM